MDRFTFNIARPGRLLLRRLHPLAGLPQGRRKSLGSKFNVQRFHDFILSQGLLPPNLLRKAVMEDFVARRATSVGRLRSFRTRDYRFLLAGNILWFWARRCYRPWSGGILYQATHSPLALGNVGLVQVMPVLLLTFAGRPCRGPL